MEITPLTHPLAAQVTVPGSKSITNRALLLAAFAQGQTTLQNALFSEDSQYLAEALDLLGFPVSLNPNSKSITIIGFDGHIPADRAELYIGNAGTAARFLTAMLATGHGNYRLDGNERMRQRPIGDLVIALTDLGAPIEAEGQVETDPREICPPLLIRAKGLAGGEVSVRGDISSQYLSGLLMAAPLAANPVELRVEGPLNSRPYIDMTLGVMDDFGVNVERSSYERFTIAPQKYSSPGKYRIEPDASAASYFFAAPAICGGWVEVEGISRKSRQGDIGFLDVLEGMGCKVSQTFGAIRVDAPEELHGIDVDMSDISDTSMTLAAIAPFADSPTTIRGIASSRVKESDRVSATVTELRRLGVRVDEHPDGMTIHPCQDFNAASIQTYNDHRMAMAFALVGLRLPGIVIQNPDCVAKTFPDYFQVLEGLR